jgi:hypothetical protein
LFQRIEAKKKKIEETPENLENAKSIFKLIFFCGCRKKKEHNGGIL